MIRLLVTLGVVAVAAGTFARGQEFDVASVKENTSVAGPMDDLERGFWTGALRPRPRNGRLRLTAVPVSLLIELAYDVTERQVVGGPSWIRSARFDIDTRIDPSATWTEARPMLRALLGDRFKLAVQRETRTLPVYELTPARGGPKLQLVTEEDCAKAPPLQLGGPLTTCGGHRRLSVSLPPDRLDRIEAAGIDMAVLADLVAAEVGRTVVDKTGVPGRFRLALEFTPAAAARDGGGSIFTALQEQLGLRLVSAEALGDVLVIERVDRPSAN